MRFSSDTDLLRCWRIRPISVSILAVARVLGALPLMPEYYLLVGMLTGVAALGPLWRPLWLAGPLAVLALMLSVTHAVIGRD